MPDFVEQAKAKMDAAWVAQEIASTAFNEARKVQYGKGWTDQMDAYNGDAPAPVQRAYDAYEAACAVWAKARGEYEDAVTEASEPAR